MVNSFSSDDDEDNVRKGKPQPLRIVPLKTTMDLRLIKKDRTVMAVRKIGWLI